MIYRFFVRIRNVINRVVFLLVIRPSLGGCGKHVIVGKNCSFHGIQNIVFGNHVSIGESSLFMSTRAKIVVGDHVFTGPNV